MSETTWIYGLKSADSSEIRYVGASIDPVIRMRHHLRRATSQGIRAWIKECDERGIEIVLVCLEAVPVGSLGTGIRRPEVAEAEDRWMVRLLDDGHRLLNVRRPSSHCEAAGRNTKLLEDAIERGRTMFGTD